MASAAHRPGPLKQQNKSHKHGKHKSKGESDKAFKGKVGAKTLSKRTKKVISKLERRNQMNSKRKTQREEVFWSKREIGGATSAPHVIAVIGVAEDVDPFAFVDQLEGCDPDEAVVTISPLGTKHLAVPRFKTRYHFLTPKPGDLHAILDAAKAADTILFAYSLETGVDVYGEYIFSVLFGHGLPSSVHAVTGIKALPPKKQSEAKKVLQRIVEKRFPGQNSRVFSLDSPQDSLLLLRQANEGKRKIPALRQHRSFLLAENVAFQDDSVGDGVNEVGTLLLTGYVRSNPLSVNGLLHLPGWGDFQISQIDAPNDPHPLPNKSKNYCPTDDDGLTVSFSKPNKDVQESTQSEAIVDPLEGEQTWPTDEEMAEAEEEERRRKSLVASQESLVKVVKKVPKGTSEYQAAWIMDEAAKDNENDEDPKEGGEVDDGEDEDDDDDEEMSDDEGGLFAAKGDDASDDDEFDGESGSQIGDGDDDEEYEEISVGTDKDAKYDEGMDEDEETANLEKLRKQRKEQEMFPDEVDTPMDKEARVRFAKYRGLKSFRTSEWDPKENLPTDYARIFQFANFQRTRKNVLSRGEDDEFEATPGGRSPGPGLYVTVYVANVPKRFVHSLDGGAPLVVFQPLKHEQKMSVINVVLRTAHDAAIVKSKDKLLFHIGFRRFSAQPVFSQHTNGTRHKYSRFLEKDGGVTVATFYAPITFAPASVLAFKEMKDGSNELVATGALLSVNPDRIVAKRIVLSGHPYRIFTKSAIVRYMFFNRGDIEWFKPIELRTKWGRRGHIQDTIGTRGHMRCFFDGKLKSQDTVMMNLYKRVYPKWTYQPRVRNPAPLIDFKPKRKLTSSSCVNADLFGGRPTNSVFVTRAASATDDNDQDNEMEES